MAKLKKKTIKTPKGRKAVVRVSRWFAPYVRKGSRYRTTLKYITKATCGVYIIRSKQTKKILYVGHSGGQLYKTLYRHFQSWDDPRQYRAEYSSKMSYEVMIVLTSSCDRAYQIEQYYINKLEPRDGIRKLELDFEDVTFKAMPNPVKNAEEEYEKLLQEVPF